MKKEIMMKKTKNPLIPIQRKKNQVLTLAKAKVIPASTWMERTKKSCMPSWQHNKKVQWHYPSKKTKVLIWMNWSIKKWSSCSMFASVCIVQDQKLWNQSLSILDQTQEIKKHSFQIWTRLCSMPNSWPMNKMKLMTMVILFLLCKVKSLALRMFKDSSR